MYKVDAFLSISNVFTLLHKCVENQLYVNTAFLLAKKKQKPNVSDKQLFCLLFYSPLICLIFI
jgi:hypothetical protein